MGSMGRRTRSVIRREQIRNLLMCRSAEGIVLEIGHMYGDQAATARALGCHYVGVEIDGRSLPSPSGLEVHSVGARAVCEPGVLSQIVAGRAVGAIVVADAISFVCDPISLISELRGLMPSSCQVPLIISCPNLSSFENVSRLILGRSLRECEPSRLRQFRRDDLESMIELSGLVVADEVHITRVLPSESSVLDDSSGSSPIGEFIREIHAAADEYSDVSEFIVVTRNGPHNSSSDSTSAGATPKPSAADRAPFLEVVIHTFATSRAPLVNSLTCLYAQTTDDFVVVVLVAGDAVAVERASSVVQSFPDDFANRVTVVAADPIRARAHNVALESSEALYVAFMAEADVVTANWVQLLITAADISPRKLVRTRPASREVTDVEVGGPGAKTAIAAIKASDKKTPTIESLFEEVTPMSSVAFPVGPVAELGLVMDSSKTRFSFSEYVVRSASLLGVHHIGEIAAIAQIDVDADANRDEPLGVRGETFEPVVDAAYLAPPGLVSELKSVIDAAGRVDVLARENSELQLVAHDQARQKLELLESTTWRASAGVRRFVTWMKGAGRG